MVPNEELQILTIHFKPPKRKQPLYKGQNAWSQGVLYMEVPLYAYISFLHLVLFLHQIYVVLYISYSDPWFEQSHLKSIYNMII